MGRRQKGMDSRSAANLQRLGELAIHVVGQLPDVFAARVAEVEAGLGELRRVAVGPESEERIARVQRSPGVVVVERARARDLRLERPRLALIGARPEAHLAAPAVGPRAG